MTLRALHDPHPVGERVRVFPEFPGVVVAVLPGGRREVRLDSGPLRTVSVMTLITE